MRQYKVSAGTARKALGELVDKGYLRSERGSGHYLRKEVIPPAAPTVETPTRSAEVATAIMAIVGSPGPWGQRRMEEYLAAIEQACRREGWSLLRARNEADDIARAAKGKRVAGCLAFGVDGPPAGKIDPAMVITWGGSQPDPASAIMGIDQESTSRLAYEHLSDLGHQCMAMVRPMAWESLEEARKREGSILGMRKAYADLGYPWSLEDVIRVGPQEMDGLYERLCDAGITGIFSEYWGITVELYRQANRLGETLGERLSLVASGGYDLSDMVHPRPARIFWRAVDYAAVVVKAIRRLEDGTPLPPRLIVPVFLESGPSARSPRHV
jgi:DNA-binding LacI/PurR family transcriptional regulator